MKSELWVGLGLGAALGALGGMLLMNNCRNVRLKVADVQDAVADKIEAKKRAFIESRYMSSDSKETDAADMQKSKKK